MTRIAAGRTSDTDDSAWNQGENVARYFGVPIESGPQIRADRADRADRAEE